MRASEHSSGEERNTEIKSRFGCGYGFEGQGRVGVFHGGLYIAISVKHAFSSSGNPWRADCEKYRA